MRNYQAFFFSRKAETIFGITRGLCRMVCGDELIPAGSRRSLMKISSGFLFFKPDASGYWDHEGMCGMRVGTSNPSGITEQAFEVNF
jgi:hypothetical protein